MTDRTVHRHCTALMVILRRTGIDGNTMQNWQANIPKHSLRGLEQRGDGLHLIGPDWKEERWQSVLT
jgi:hypothetical protein